MNERSDFHQIIEIQSLRKEFKTSSGFISQLLYGETSVNVAVENISLTIKRGETLALAGESGCGKTTLGRMVCMLETPTEGKILLDGEEITQTTEKRKQNLRTKIQIIFQNPYDSLDPRQKVFSLVEQPLRLLNMGETNTWYRHVLEMINAVGLRPAETFIDRYPHELSGGQRQRVAIARAMILDPEVLVADEPVSMLDVSIRAGVLNTMMDLKDRMGTAYLFITHDLSVASYVSDRLAIMYLGTLVEIGLTKNVVNQPIHPYTRLLLAAVPRLHWRRSVGRKVKRTRVKLVGDVEEEHGKKIPGCKFAPRCPLAQKICYQDMPPLEIQNGMQHVACHFAKESFSMSENELLKKASVIYDKNEKH
jgi:peptide/nickel transport system ATP-binding protein